MPPARSVRSELDIQSDDFMLTMIAEFGAVKRHAHLFDALARLHDPRIVVVLVGDGPLESRLREKAVALGIRPPAALGGLSPRHTRRSCALRTHSCCALSVRD